MKKRHISSYIDINDAKYITSDDGESIMSSYRCSVFTDYYYGPRYCLFTLPSFKGFFVDYRFVFHDNGGAGSIGYVEINLSCYFWGEGIWMTCVHSTGSITPTVYHKYDGYPNSLYVAIDVGTQASRAWVTAHLTNIYAHRYNNDSGPLEDIKRTCSARFITLDEFNTYTGYALVTSV